MGCLSYRYEIVFMTSPLAGIIPLRETEDPNVATIAFHLEMERLREDGATGELVLINYDDRRQLMLRQPLRPPGAMPPQLVRPRQLGGLHVKWWQ